MAIQTQDGSPPEPQNEVAGGLDTAQDGDSKELDQSPNAKDAITNTGDEKDGGGGKDDGTGALEEKLLAAARDGNEEVVRDLLQKEEEIKINATDVDGRSALHLAAKSGHQKVVQELLKTSNRIGIIHQLWNLKDNYGETALHLASSYDWKEVVQELLNASYGTEIINDLLISKTKSGRTALHLASAGGYKEVVQELLNASDRTGTTKDLLISKENEGSTALHLASWRGHEEAIKELLNTNYGLRSEYLNLKDEDGRTALHIACKGRDESVKVLLDRKAEISLQTANGKTPLMEAIWHSHESIVELLVENGADIKTHSNNYSILTAAYYGPKTDKIVQYLLDKDLDVNEKDPDGWAPIHTALWVKSDASLAVVKLLISRGANLEAQNSWKKTPLHLALEERNQETIRLILENSQNVDIADEEGLTPLIACRG
ncbi:hypothetical protein EYB25_009795 [Talaromyces marneffei]|nr:hypothetical protein EYB25_009795 [Talaromyces marneffei]